MISKTFALLSFIVLLHLACGTLAAKKESSGGDDIAKPLCPECIAGWLALRHNYGCDGNATSCLDAQNKTACQERIDKICYFGCESTVSKVCAWKACTILIPVCNKPELDEQHASIENVIEQAFQSQLSLAETAFKLVNRKRIDRF
jgi:hypothetical protein